MTRSAAYRDGFREASKMAVSALHQEANMMNDPHARRILDAAAFAIGILMKRRLEAMGDEPDA